MKEWQPSRSGVESSKARLGWFPGGSSRAQLCLSSSPAFFYAAPQQQSKAVHGPCGGPEQAASPLEWGRTACPVRHDKERRVTLKMSRATHTLFHVAPVLFVRPKH